MIIFPGTWSDMDFHHVLLNVFRQEVEYVWHKETDLSPYDCVILPGGFSYGDYLRVGAIARFSPVMGAIERELAKIRSPVLPMWSASTLEYGVQWCSARQTSTHPLT
ncbi:MAG TPA: hypothetical protein DCY61_01115 [Dehalococcoidia bacterium]|nr:hypothetical protein [Dehalococcoidia bacterium]